MRPLVQAIRFDEGALEIHPDNLNTRFHLGLFYLALGNFDKSKQLYLEALSLASLGEIQSAIEMLNKYSDIFLNQSQVEEIKALLQSSEKHLEK